MPRNEMEQVWSERFVKLAGDPFRDGVTHRIMGEMVAYKTLVPMQPVAILRIETVFTHALRSNDGEWVPCSEMSTGEECAVCRGLLNVPSDVLIEEIERTSTTIWKRLSALSADAERALITAARQARNRLLKSWCLKVASEWVLREPGKVDDYSAAGASARYKNDMERIAHLVYVGEEYAPFINVASEIAGAARGLIVDAMDKATQP